jgi:hypothetical protein
MSTATLPRLKFTHIQDSLDSTRVTLAKDAAAKLGYTRNPARTRYRAPARIGGASLHEQESPSRHVVRTQKGNRLVDVGSLDVHLRNGCQPMITSRHPLR